jgi:hypothetical protein
VPALSTQLGRRARLRRLLPGLAIAIAHIAVLVWFVAPATDSGAQTPEAPQIDMTVSQSTGLVDGQVLDVTVSPRPGVRIDPNSRSHNVYICRPGIEYRTRQLPAVSLRLDIVALEQAALPAARRNGGAHGDPRRRRPGGLAPGQPDVPPHV